MCEKEVVILRTQDVDEDWGPDIVVGIDFGMTFTGTCSPSLPKSPRVNILLHKSTLIQKELTEALIGVAYSCAPEWHPPRTIQRWPGKLPGELANKVPTCIQYESETGSVKRWGFSCDHEDDTSPVQEFFKLHLAPQYCGNYPGEPSRYEAQKWFTDYIRCVYEHVVYHFNATIPNFSSRKVEFLFSVPTTWKDVRMVEETRSLLERAVCAKTKNHRVSIGLTEAEAAAVYAGNEHYKVSLQ